MTLEVASGTLIPAARNVNPITESGMDIVLPERICLRNVVSGFRKTKRLAYLPTTVIIHDTKYDVVAIHTMHMRNVRGHNFCLFFFLQSGIVRYNAKAIGHDMK